jgi:putative nucleotidyltransferase with HDIG domain
MKITTRVTVSSLVMISIILFLGATGYFGLTYLYKKTADLEEISGELDAVSNLNLSMHEAVSYLNNYLVTGDPEEKERFANASKEVKRLFEAIAAIEGEAARTDASLENARRLYANMEKMSGDLFKYEVPLASRDAILLTMEIQETADWISRLYIQVHYLKDRGKLERVVKEAETTKRWVDAIQKTGAVVAPIIGLLLILYNTRSIIGPIKRLRDGALKVSAGNWSYRFDIKDGEELMDLANAIDRMSRTILTQMDELDKLFRGTIKALASAVDAKSPWTRGHSERVTSYSLAVGAEMGLSESDLKTLELAGLLHDIGKIGIYETILDKAARLTEDEVKIMREHPGKGAEILSHVKHFEAMVPIVRGHHESYDGSGYPDGLKGGEIPLMARILAVCDTYDAMTSDRPYRKGRTKDEAIRELRRCSGTQFDSDVVKAFAKAMWMDYQI